jgi:hypothetical protein
MNGRAEAPLSLLSKSRLPAERIIYYPGADETVFREIRCGVLFVMAFWSGPSVMAFARLTEVLSNLDPDGRLQFVVVDTDGVPALYEMAEFLGRMHGAGETAWVKDGRIVRTSGLGFNPDCFVPNTLELLAECMI